MFWMAATGAWHRRFEISDLGPWKKLWKIETLGFLDTCSTEIKRDCRNHRKPWRWKGIDQIRKKRLGEQKNGPRKLQTKVVFLICSIVKLPFWYWNQIVTIHFLWLFLLMSLSICCPCKFIHVTFHFTSVAVSTAALLTAQNATWLKEKVWGRATGVAQIEKCTSKKLSSSYLHANGSRLWARSDLPLGNGNA